MTSTIIGLNALVNKDAIDPNLNSSNSNVHDTMSELSKDITDIAHDIGINLDNITIQGEKDKSNEILSVPDFDHQPTLPPTLTSTLDSSTEHKPILSSPTPAITSTQIPSSPPVADVDKHQMLNNFIGGLQNNNTGSYLSDYYQEEVNNRKSMLLEQIELIKLLLQEEDPNVSLPYTDENDNIQKLEHIYRILKIKKDRLSFNSLGEEVLMFLVHILEGVFDGERIFFNRFRPDLKGWSNVVSLKLRRLRYETSNIVSDIVSTYNISYGTRLCLELLPSMFLYSASKSLHKQRFSTNNLNENMAKLDNIS